MLPEEDTDFTLVDEDLEEYTVKYLPANKGMSGGWRGFSNAHNLKPQDALIFHLTKDTEFKVYIVRGEAESERENDEEESQEVLVRKRNARLKIMIQEQEFFKLRNDSIRRDREMMMKKLESMSSQDDQVKSDLAASSINALSLE
ncbi:B3 domain-containing protein At3g19184-like [Papaver somniferum]|uniref:B3 domain-containing protein At3g19184-like n=1 Tax=Papaver somniferum TaxID=3469 RepID=UPI000E6FA561|nr:B3 domain-containing protein At3g19184-like [Papaver somniferum]